MSTNNERKVKTTPPGTLPSSTRACSANSVTQMKPVILALTLFSVACSSSSPLPNPSPSSADTEPTNQNPFSPVPTGDNPALAPSDTDNNTDTDTPVQIDEPIGEPLGTTLPELSPAEALPELDNSDEEPEPVIVSRASCTASDSDMQQRVLQLINDARATARNCGSDSFAPTRGLSWNTRLADAARAHSNDMATTNFFSHTGSDGSQASSRVTSAGYTWRTVGENIAAGRETAEESLNDWLESPGHCRNIMNPSFTEVAVACVEDSNSDFTRYWTNVLAAPR